jgi:hypothetical protein
MTVPFDPKQQKDHLCELLAERALWQLSPEEELEIETLIASGHADDDPSLEMTAAVLCLSMMKAGDFRPLPEEAKRQLDAAGAAWAAATSSVLRPRVRSRTRMVLMWSPWLAAAAGLVLAVIAWSPRSVAADPIKLVDKAPDKVDVPLVAWSGTSAQSRPIGCVCWSEKCQCGFVHLNGAPCNDCEHQYQLWIIDSRGEEQRISGCVFDCKGNECLVPIRPELAVHDAKSFTITLEKPGGMAVPDLNHKVAVAKCKGHH